MSAPRSDIVTFLFTDIEGSTRLWQDHEPAMSADLALHDALVRRVIESAGGTVFKTVGDTFYAVFPAPAERSEVDTHMAAVYAGLQDQRRTAVAQKVHNMPIEQLLLET
jgi:class 3 adenylate cyclase